MPDHTNPTTGDRAGPPDTSAGVPAGFAAGVPILVTGGRYDGQWGVVVHRTPDLRPGSVWVDLADTGVHLVPSYRLTPDLDTTS